jgi:hypothetical protein
MSTDPGLASSWRIAFVLAAKGEGRKQDVVPATDTESVNDHMKPAVPRQVPLMWD